MNRAKTRRLSLWTLLLALWGCGHDRVEKPDFFLIVVDTLRADHVGYASDGAVSTPNIDALADEGHRFEHAFSHSPITGPSHAAMFTGRRPSEAGVVNNVKQAIPESLNTLPEILAAHGYTCHGVVSLGPLRGRLGFARGFTNYGDELGPGFLRPTVSTLAEFREQLESAAHSIPPQFHFIHIADPHEPYDALGSVVHEAQVLWDGEPLRTIDTATFDPMLIPLELGEGTHELVVRGDHPFRLRRCSLVHLHGAEIHTSDTPSTKEYRSEWRIEVRVDVGGSGDLAIALDDLDGSHEEIQRRYRLEAENTDRFIGEILDSIRGAGRYDESLIIFSSDHGEALGLFKGVGHVVELYDRYLQVPLVVKAPRSWAWDQQVVRRDLVVHADFLPTLCELLKIPPPEGIVGVPFYDSPTDEDRIIVLETHAPQAPHTKYGVRSAVHKLIWTPELDRWEFFELVTDPNEQTNLFDEQREAAQPYVERLFAERDAMNRRAAALSGEPFEVDEDAEEVLRALGYVN